MNIVAMIPARIGSTRLKMKNLALINNKPMIYYSINKALEADIFNKVVINSDSQIFSTIAKKYGVEFYNRNKKLGSSTTKSDEVVLDFIDAYKEADIIVWLNPIAPFQKISEIKEAINYFKKNNLDSLITVENKKVHCNFNGSPVNYSPNEPFAQTQDLIPVQPFSYTIMMWRTDTFRKEYELNGHALFCGNFDVFPVSTLSSLIIKNEDDLKLADYIMQRYNDYNDYLVRYDKIIDNIIMEKK